MVSADSDQSSQNIPKARSVYAGAVDATRSASQTRICTRSEAQQDHRSIPIRILKNSSGNEKFFPPESQYGEHASCPEG